MVKTASLIGRDKELAALDEFIIQASAGGTSLVFISGEGGIGKTYLAEHCLSRNNIKYFISRPFQEASPPYGIFASILHELQRSPSFSNINALFPELLSLLPEYGTASKEVDKDVLIFSLASVLKGVSAGEPLALLLDDIHWADNASLEALLSLSEELANTGILLICTYRNEELPRGHQLRWIRNELRRRKKLAEIFLYPLDREASAELINAILEENSSPALIDKIYEKTQGIPFFIEELCEVLIEKKLINFGGSAPPDPLADLPLPENIRDAILLRVSALSDKAVQMLELAAVIGDEFEISILEKVQETSEGLDELFDGDFLRETSSGKASIKHSLIRDSVKSAMTWSRRRELNRKAAEFLSAYKYQPDILAELWLEAKEFDKARASLLEAANRSCAVHAFRDAARSAYRALEIWPEGEDEYERMDTLLNFAHCAKISGQLNDAVKFLKEVSEFGDKKKEPLITGKAESSLADIYNLQGKWDASHKARVIAAHKFEEAGSPENSASEYLMAGARFMAMLKLNDAIESASKAIELADKCGKLEIKARGLGLLGNAKAMLGKTEEGKRTVQDGLELALENNLSEAASDIYRRLAHAMEYASDYAGAKEAYYSAYNFCVRTGADVSAQVCLSCMSAVLFITGEWKRSLEFCAEVLKNKKSPDGSKLTAYGMASLIYAFRGEIKPSRRYYDRALAQYKKYESMLMFLTIQWAKAVVAEVENDHASAFEIYKDMLGRWSDLETRHDSIPILMWAAHNFAINKAEKELFMAADAFSVISRGSDNPEAFAGLSYTLGELALLKGDIKEAEYQLRQALVHQEKFNFPLEKVFLEVRLSEILIMSGKGEEACRRLDSALASSRNLSTRPLSSKILSIMESAGLNETPDNPTEEKLSSSSLRLTRRQNEILKLLSTGLTNKEIADKLFLSARTVDMHVSHIFERLNCRTRTEAVSRANEIGILA